MDLIENWIVQIHGDSGDTIVSDAKTSEEPCNQLSPLPA